MSDGAASGGIRSDGELAAAYSGASDEAAFGELVARHGGMVHRVCLGLLADEHGAEDAAQAVFIVLAQKARSLRSKGDLGAWLFGVARNVALRALRDRSRRAENEKRAAAMKEQMKGNEEQGEERIKLLADLYGQLGSLSEKQRQAVVLLYLEGKGQRDAARLAGCEQSALGKRASDGLAKLRGLLAGKGHLLGAAALAGLLGAEAEAACPPFLIAVASKIAAAGAGQAAVSGNAALLAKGAMKMMFWAKVKAVAAICAVTVAVGGAGTYGVAKLAMADAKPAPAVASGDEKVLFGFEPAELKKLEELREQKKYLKFEFKGENFCFDMMQSSSIKKMSTTEGEYALVTSPRKKTGAMRKENNPTYLIPELAHCVTTGKGGTPGRIFLPLLWTFLQERCPSWSGYQFLRFDVKTNIPNFALRVVIEDDYTVLPVVRIIKVPADAEKWSTAEIDLEEAAGKCGLNLDKIVNLFFATEECADVGQCFIDNIRLCKKGTKASLPVLKDDAPMMDMTEYLKKQTTPAPRKPPVPPDHSPIKLEKPIVIDAGELVAKHKYKGQDKPAAMNPIGFVGAFDNKHMLVGFSLVLGEGGNTITMQTADGGKTWADAPCGDVLNPDHGCSRGGSVDAFGDVVIFSNLGCATAFGWMPHGRYYCVKTTFNGTGWEERPTLRDDQERGKNKRDLGLVDWEARHCTSNGSCVRLANGRLWAAWSHIGRAGYVAIGAKYSDDDGITWRAPSEGRGGIIPGSEDTSRFRYGTYHFMTSHVTPYGEHVAVVWQQNAGIFWSYYDGKEWSKPDKVNDSGFQYGSFGNTDLHAVTVGEKDIFVSSPTLDKILHWDGKTWKDEPIKCAPRSPLAVAGKTLMVFSPEKNGDGLKLLCHRRAPDGTWKAPVVVAEEGDWLSTFWRKGVKQAIATQPYSPPNFAPVAYSCGKNNQIKIVRVPVE